MKRYDKYKDSGVDWIGEIPEHWEMLSNKYIFKLTKSQVGKKSADFELLSLTLKGIIKRDMENPEGKFPAEFDTYQKVKKGDFVFCLFDVEETPRTVGLSDFNGMITGAYTVFTGSPKTNSKYLFYFYLNLDEKKRLKFLYRGLRNTIPKDSFFSFKTTFPPLPEQQAIASFLDDKTAKIDQTISIKEKEIELLKERRQILIQKAVTKGLDDKVKFKDSGVEWIGEVPEHWKVSFIKRFSYNITDGSHSSPETTHEGKNYVSVKDVNDSGEIDLVSCKKISNKDFKLLVRNGCQPKLNDLLLTKDGTIGRAAVVSENDFVILSSLGLITPNSKILNPYFLRYHFISPHTVENMYSLIAGSALTRLTIEKIKKIEIVVPSLNEQTQIVAYLEKIEEKISKAISLKQQEIEKLKEYKTVLIDNVVTGKVKVS
ncbi:restriction endonuclease subunit S [Sphingobacterium spiritivorum]